MQNCAVVGIATTTQATSNRQIRSTDCETNSTSDAHAERNLAETFRYVRVRHDNWNVFEVSLN